MLLKPVPWIACRLVAKGAELLISETSPPSRKTQKSHPVTDQPPKPALTTEPTVKCRQENQPPVKQVLSRELCAYHVGHTPSLFFSYPEGYGGWRRRQAAGLQALSLRLVRQIAEGIPRTGMQTEGMRELEVLLDVKIRRSWLSHIVSRLWIILHF